MRPQVRKFIEICSVELNLLEPIVEIGAKRHPSQDKIADLRTLFSGRNFVGCDMEVGAGVDRIENLERLSFKDGEVGTFVLSDTLEHVRDLDKAMKELGRCLDPETGVLIATSVMLFPVHAFPNDYWRFTPEGFRALAKGFGWVSTFYGGDPNFPHTVAFIACRQAPNTATFEHLLQSVANLTPVPHHVDRKSVKMFSSLGSLLIQQARLAGQKESPVNGEMGVFSRDGWVLSPGSWLNIMLPKSTDADKLEMKASGRIVQVVDRGNWNSLIAETKNGLSETAFLFSPTDDITIQITQLEAYLVSPSGERNLIARTGLGVILPQEDLPSGFSLHAIDDRRLPAGVDLTTAKHANVLIHDLRKRGEKIVLDLGCGFRKAGNIGIDATPQNTDADLICLLGFESLPFTDSAIDEVICRDFLEHLPKAVYLESKGRLHYPLMQLMDEVWRVLKPGGVFRSWTPMYPHPEVFQDPTHLSVWTIKSMDYFCGDYAVARRIYGIQACFEKVNVREDGFYLVAELRKPMA